jgi:hypothetical protein
LRPGATRARTPGTAAPVGSDGIPLDLFSQSAVPFDHCASNKMNSAAIALIVATARHRDAPGW